MVKIITKEIVSPEHAARQIGISTRRLAQLVGEDRIAAIVDSSGRRTFRVEDVDRLVRERRARQ